MRSLRRLEGLVHNAFDAPARKLSTTSGTHPVSVAGCGRTMVTAPGSPLLLQSLCLPLCFGAFKAVTLRRYPSCPRAVDLSFLPGTRSIV